MENEKELEEQGTQNDPVGDPKPEEGGEETPKNEELAPEELADLKKNAAASSQNFERAKKAEEELKELKKNPKEPKAPKEKQEGLSDKDVIYIAKSDIHDDDVDEVTSYAKFKDITVQEAHKALQPILTERAEERKTAEVTETTGRTPTPKPQSPDVLIDQARKGQFSEEDADIQALADAQHEKKKLYAEQDRKKRGL